MTLQLCFLTQSYPAIALVEQPEYFVTALLADTLVESLQPFCMQKWRGGHMLEQESPAYKQWRQGKGWNGGEGSNGDGSYQI